MHKEAETTHFNVLHQKDGLVQTSKYFKIFKTSSSESNWMRLLRGENCINLTTPYVEIKCQLDATDDFFIAPHKLDTWPTDTNQPPCNKPTYDLTLDAGLLARSQYPEGPATGHLDTGFSWFPYIYKRMLRWFPSFQVATTCFSCSPPDLNFLVTFFSYLCTCKITTATGWQPNCS